MEFADPVEEDDVSFADDGGCTPAVAGALAEVGAGVGIFIVGGDWSSS